MKRYLLLFPLAIFSLMPCGCGESKTPSSDEKTDDKDKKEDKEEEKSAFEIACDATGGVYENGKCKCDSIICDDGDVCNSNTRKCPEKSLPEVCSKDSIICNNSILFKCNSNNKFVEEKDCDYGCLPDHSACAVCLADKCEDAGIITKCVAGEYQAPTYCKSGSCKNDSACYQECEEGEKICEDGKIKECKKEEYVEIQRCEFGCDKNNTNTCATGCEENDQICTDGLIKVCSSGKYGTPISCPNGFSCSSETECGDCKNDKVYCVNDDSQIGYLRTCRNGQLIAGGFNCNDNHSCNPDTNSCGVCKNGERRCVNDDVTKIGHIEICENGQFVPENSECPGSFSCKTATSCGECLNETQTCTNDENELGIEHRCTNGVLTHYSCDNVSCKQNSCGECRDGEQHCGNDKYSVNMLLWCNNGRLEKDDCKKIDPAKQFCRPGNKECTDK